MNAAPDESVNTFFIEQAVAGRPIQEVLAGAPLVAAVSGGPDSLALLHALARSGRFTPGQLVAAHFDHQLRPDSPADADFVRRIAAGWGLRFEIGRADVAALAAKHGRSLEEAGRLARYRFLAEAAGRCGAAVIATGHTSDDQAETVLMHFLRGSGLAGLRGMAPIGSLPGCPELALARPLLASSHAATAAYCSEHGLEARQDASNQETAYFRNWLRRVALPLLDKRVPGLKERLNQMAEVARADFAFLSSLEAAAWSGLVLDAGPGWLRLNRGRWLSLPVALQRAMFRRALGELQPGLRDIGFRPVELARKVAAGSVGGRKVDLPGGATLEVQANDLVLRLAWTAGPAGALPQLPDGRAMPLPVPGRVALTAGWAIRADEVTGSQARRLLAEPDPWQAVVQLPAGAALVVRPRRPAERFQPLGMAGHTASVKEVMINRKLPAGQRPLWPLVTTADHLAWLVGHHLDGRAAVRDLDAPAVLLRVTRGETEPDPRSPQAGGGVLAGR
ncbi:MAG: tRNA lysidine(34) synthetase TilS [Candidatus Promineifilaceae bacterium]